MIRIVRVLIIPAVLAITACQAKQPESAAKPAAPDTPPYTTTATVKDIMEHIVDPAGDLIWDSVATTVDSKGVHQTLPTTDEDWKKVRSGAIMLVEASNLRMVPGRHVAKSGEKSETPGIELEPSEMEAMINKDRAAWYQRAGKLHDMASKALAVIEAKDSKALFDVGAELDTACENCHRQYWYPNEPVQPLTNEPDPKPETKSDSKPAK